MTDLAQFAVVRIEQGTAPVTIQDFPDQDEAEKFCAVCNRIAGDELAHYVVEDSGAN